MNSLSGVMVIGLTGQTGAGKSTVSKVFSQNGFAIINADIVSMCYTYIKPLIDYEVTSNVNLIETLLVFFHNKQNYSKTGEQSHRTAHLTEKRLLQ